MQRIFTCLGENLNVKQYLKELDNIQLRERQETNFIEKLFIAL